MHPLIRGATALLALFGLASCAARPTVPALPETRMDLSLKTQVPQPDRALAPLLASGLRLDAAEGLFRYRADYALQPSGLFGSNAPLQANRLPSQVGQQFIGQQLGWRLPAVAGAAPHLDLSFRQQDAMNREGLVTSQEQRQAGLRWAPQGAEVDLQWAGSSQLSGPLDCPLEGNVRLPLLALASLQLRGRDCRVVLPGSAGPAETLPQAQSWSAALEWGGGAQQPATALRLTSIAPHPAAGAGTQGPQQAYELGLSQRLPLLGWQAQTRLNYRSVPGAELQDAWSADASLRRQLAGVGLSASLRTGVDPYWFMPSVVETRNQYQLGLDLSRWVSRRLPGEQTRMGLAYQLDSYPDRPTAEAHVNSVRWDFSFRW